MKKIWIAVACIIVVSSLVYAQEAKKGFFSGWFGAGAKETTNAPAATITVNALRDKNRKYRDDLATGRTTIADLLKECQNAYADFQNVQRAMNDKSNICEKEKKYKYLSNFFMWDLYWGATWDGVQNGPTNCSNFDPEVCKSRSYVEFPPCNIICKKENRENYYMMHRIYDDLRWEMFDKCLEYPDLSALQMQANVALENACLACGNKLPVPPDPFGSLFGNPCEPEHPIPSPPLEQP